MLELVGKAKNHYRHHLLQKYGVQAFKDWIFYKKSLLTSAINHKNVSLQGQALKSWLRQTLSRLKVKEMQAIQHHRKAVTSTFLSRMQKVSTINIFFMILTVICNAATLWKTAIDRRSNSFFCPTNSSKHVPRLEKDQKRSTFSKDAR